ncbi:MAG: 3-dehydroquinate synthase [Deltaproteobacteria bacterium]|nr:3-dehydroquinate synthase [Deltaproteobacteria bacterium]
MPAPLFLIGFMAAGKTSVGRAIAAATGRRFLDLDDVIAASGEPVAALVARDEPEFRRREAAALVAVIAGAADGPVIATGGGAAVFGDNLERMRAAGLVVALGVEVREAERRAAGGPPRPLLAAAATLAAQRAPVYRRAHAVVDTTAHSIAEVASSVQAVERTWAGLPAANRDATILALGDRSYPVTVETATASGAVLHAALGTPTKIAVITDRNVAAAWLAPTLAAVAAVGPAEVIEIEPGEASKAFAVYERLCSELVARGFDRGSAIVALGGGVVGDLAGFVAATLFRGVPFVQLPTTIVAMTDAAIGGKTAVDLPAGKNLVGAFWQPRLVACGLATLMTLPGRERRAGFGELWKYALLDGPDLWRTVAACAAWAAGSDQCAPPPALRTVIDRSISYKAAIVARDEREQTGHRALLNLGHTIGHAIESASDGALLHGEAVGLGLVAACRISTAVAGTRSELEREVTEALRATGLPWDLAPWLTPDVLARVQVDKKRVGANLRFVLIRDVGVCEVAEIAVTEVRRILRLDPSP